MCNEIPTPLPSAGIFRVGTERVPAEDEPVFPVRHRLGGVQRPHIECIVFWRMPRTCGLSAHPIARLHAFAELGENKIPPISHAEQIRALVSNVKTRSP